jgi:hypothetical protein
MRIEQTRRLFEIEGKCPPPTDSLLQAAVVFDIVRFRNSGISELPYQFGCESKIKASIAHWIIKMELNPKHKHPCSRLAKVSKPLADVYHAVFKACEKLQSWGLDTLYPHASLRFAYILYEFALGKVGTIPVSIGKDSAIEALRKVNSKLTSLKNEGTGEIPFHDEEIYNEEHTYKLFEQLSQHSENIHINILKEKLMMDIIKALKTYVSHLVRNNINIVNVGETRDFVIKGRDKTREYRPNLIFKFEELTQ